MCVCLEEFPETTLMNIEISHFNLISNVLEAQKLVDLMNRVFQVYDRLIDLHEVRLLLCDTFYTNTLYINIFHINIFDV